MNKARWARIALYGLGITYLDVSTGRAAAVVAE